MNSIENRADRAVSVMEYAARVAEDFSDPNRFIDVNTNKGPIKTLAKIAQDADDAVRSLAHLVLRPFLQNNDYGNERLYFLHNETAYMPLQYPYTSGASITEDIDSKKLTVLQGLTKDSIGKEAEQLPRNRDVVAHISHALKLRELEPSFLGQEISALSGEVAGSGLGGGSFFNNPVPDGIVDDGVVNLKTALGNVWTRKNVSILTTDMFSIKPDTGVDYTARLNTMFDLARLLRVGVGFSAGVFDFSDELDISGLSITGVYDVFADTGTVLKGKGDHDGLVQKSTSVDSITMDISGIRLENIVWGLELNYSVGTKISKFQIKNSKNGIKCGTENSLGTLFNIFELVWVDVEFVALSIGGTTFSNANKFDTCFFRGHTDCAIVDSGALGAISNSFINTEFAGLGVGVLLKRNKSTTFDGCYFESDAAAVVIDGFTLGAELNSCTYGTLRKNVNGGVGSFVYHKSGSAGIRVDGGYIVIEEGADRNDLTFIKSDEPAKLNFDMLIDPNQEISATGFDFFGDGLPNNRGTVAYSSDYDPKWSAVGATPPALRNGEIDAEYTLSGSLCSVSLKLKIGSTTETALSAWRLTLPFPSLRSSVGSVYIRDSGERFYIAACRVNSYTDVLVGYNSDGTEIGNNSPIVWAEGDTIEFSIVYRYK